MDLDRTDSTPAWGATNPNLTPVQAAGPTWGAPPPGTPRPGDPAAAGAPPASAYPAYPAYVATPYAAGEPPRQEWAAAPSQGAPGPWASAQPVPAWSQVPPAEPRRRGGIAGYVAVAIATAAISAAIAFSGGLVVGTGIGASVSHDIASTVPVPSASTAPGDPAGFGLFHEAWDIVKQNYVDQQALDTKDITYGAIRGMADAIGDTGHTRFLTPKELAAQKEDWAGKFAGVGAVLNQTGADLIVQSVIPGAPAEKAGMKAGDIIVKVDGNDVTGQTVDQVVQQVRGTEGTPVTITLFRKGQDAPFDLTITRAIITNPAVSWAMYPGTQTAVIRIDQFSNGSGDETVAALKAAKEAGATKFVLDLRNDPGGYVGEATQAASQFLKSGLVFIEQDAKGTRKEVPVESGGVLTQEPLVVLVDAGSASASEIVSGAIQDAGRAKIVGETTFGTGTVLNQFDLSDGSALLVGTQQWLTPNGAEIWRKGITPDVTVSLPADGRIVIPSEFETLGADGILKANDAQLQKALEVLAQQ